jgi:SAM-dependent methyltransferase
MRSVFQQIYDNNGWRNNESVSGHGSTKEATNAIRSALPLLFERYGIESIVDVACGDLNWMGDLVIGKMTYLGTDIVPVLIERNKVKYGGLDKVFFSVSDITRDPLPPADLILVRDVLVHFSNADVKKALATIKHSRAKYLLATTFPDHDNSGDIRTGDWRPINLAQYFGLPDPILLINERCTAGGGAFADKSLGLWELGGGNGPDW